MQGRRGQGGPGRRASGGKWGGGHQSMWEQQNRTTGLIWLVTRGGGGEA